MDRLIAFRARSETATALRLAAHDRGCSVSRVIREAIDAAVPAGTNCGEKAEATWTEVQSVEPDVVDDGER